MNLPYRAIWAMSENRVIGNGLEIPWHLPEDFKWFKKTTMGGTLIMGRKTWDSIGRALPGRQTVVLSRSQQDLPEGVAQIRSLDEIEQNDFPQSIWIAGGGEVYRLALPQCSDCYVTIVKRDVEGDIHFPKFEHLFDFNELLRDEEDFQIRHYTRKL
ncbi:MAG: dihydrofolate reductase [Verrucomicrobiota bacterium]